MYYCRHVTLLIFEVKHPYTWPKKTKKKVAQIVRYVYHSGRLVEEIFDGSIGEVGSALVHNSVDLSEDETRPDAVGDSGRRCSCHDCEPLVSHIRNRSVVGDRSLPLNIKQPPINNTRSKIQVKHRNSYTTLDI